MRWWAAYLALAGLLAATVPAADESQHGSLVEVRRFELDVAPTQLEAVGDVLLANGRPGDRPLDDPRGWWGLLRSVDLGRTWESVTLPGAPGGVYYVLDGPETVGSGVAVVQGVVDVAADASDPTWSGNVAHIWASVDGRTWTGGRSPVNGRATGSVLVRAVDGVLFAALRTELYRSTDLGVSWAPATMPEHPLVANQASFVTDVWQTSRGRLVANLEDGDGSLPRPEEGPVPVLVSDDSGMTWRLDVCPSEVPSTGSCMQDPPNGYPEIRTVGNLQIRSTARGEQVSLDGGATWDDLDLPASPGLGTDVFLHGIVPRGDGGWLAVAVVNGAGDGGDEFLLASDDGVHWRDLGPTSLCGAEVHDDPDLIRPSTWFIPPVGFDGRWLVIHSCSAENARVQSELLLVDVAAGEAVPILGTRRDAVGYGSPVAVGDTVVMLESRDEGPVAVLQVRPSS